MELLKEKHKSDNEDENESKINRLTYSKLLFTSKKEKLKELVDENGTDKRIYELDRLKKNIEERIKLKKEHNKDDKKYLYLFLGYIISVFLNSSSDYIMDISLSDALTIKEVLYNIVDINIYYPLQIAVSKTFWFVLLATPIYVYIHFIFKYPITIFNSEYKILLDMRDVVEELIYEEKNKEGNSKEVKNDDLLTNC